MTELKRHSDKEKLSGYRSSQNQEAIRSLNTCAFESEEKHQVNYKGQL